MKWVLMVFVGSGVPVSVGHFSTRDACIEAVPRVQIPEIDGRGRIEGFASLNAKSITLFCVPVEKLMNESAPAAND
ncbi:hypothetical protein [Thalassobaculum sp.]|uniref:hypothetical protein n=1 Tax=Thalassobaculum sp. TaxID=2022740 RepID=UPI0032EC54BF